MGRVLTNQVSLAYSIELSLGVLEASPTWKRVEPNDISTFGATITKVARDPISPDRQRRKGTTTDLDSSVEYEADTTLDSMRDFIEGFMFASARYPTAGGAGQVPPIQSGAAFANLAAVAATPGYSHDAIAQAMGAGTLVLARGFADDANNNASGSLQEVDAAGSTTSTPIVGGAQVDETPGNQANAQLEVGGVRGAIADITWTQATLTIGSTVLDFTTLGLNVGQLLHLGGLLSANQFAGGVLFGRVRSIAANAIVIDKPTGTLIADDAGAGLRIDILFGCFIRNVPVGDPDFLERSYQFELGLPNLQVPGPGDEFQYSIGNQANLLTVAAPLTDKSTLTPAFVGLDTPNPVTIRKAGGATPVLPVETVAYNTSSNIGRLRIQEEDGTEITQCFTDLTMTLNNQITPQKCLGTLGAVFLNNGNLLVDFDATVLLTDSRLQSAVRDNRTMTFDLLLQNDDGGVGLDIPALTLGDGALALPRNESVTISEPGEAFGDPSLGYSASWSLFPALP